MHLPSELAASEVLQRVTEACAMNRPPRPGGRIIAEPGCRLGIGGLQCCSEQIRYASDLEALEQERRLLQLSGQNLERTRRLQKQKLGSDSELDQARQELARQRLSLATRERAISDYPARVQALEAKLKRAQARLQTTELDLERSRIVAPYPGRIASVEVAEGNQVSPNQQLLALYDPARLELRARIPVPFLDELVDSGSAGPSLEGFIGDGERRILLD